MEISKDMMKRWVFLLEGVEPTDEELDFGGDPDQEEQRIRSNAKNSVDTINHQAELVVKMKKNGNAFMDAMLDVLRGLCFKRETRNEARDILDAWAEGGKDGDGRAEMAKDLKRYLSGIDGGAPLDYRYSKNDVYESGDEIGDQA